jgi:hypothetical protein
VIQVRDITRLTESIHAEGNRPMPSDRTHPRECRRVRIDDGHYAGVGRNLA